VDDVALRDRVHLLHLGAAVVHGRVVDVARQEERRVPAHKVQIAV
jgi:ABC-type uncharacterized transport system ATPase subunit